MSGQLQDAEYWFKREQDARVQAAEAPTAKARRTLLEVAENFRQLAEQARASGATRAK